MDVDKKQFKSFFFNLNIALYAILLNDRKGIHKNLSNTIKKKDCNNENYYQISSERIKII